jgi:hypothetical protein
MVQKKAKSHTLPVRAGPEYIAVCLFFHSKKYILFLGFDGNTKKGRRAFPRRPSSSVAFAFLLALG